jgi:hypothetical protein
MRSAGVPSLLSGWRSAAVLGSLLVACWLPGSAAAQRGDALAGKASRHARYIGMEYEVWFPGIPAQGTIYGGERYWEKRWGTPLLGTYDSTDPKVIDKHAEWLAAIGVDFVLIDWANNIANALSGPTIVGDTIRAKTDAVFQEYRHLRERGLPHPRMAILLGAQNENGVPAQDAISSGSLNREADHVYDHFVSTDPDLYFSYKGKPLLVIYLGVPAGLNPPPSWTALHRSMDERLSRIAAGSLWRNTGQKPVLELDGPHPNTGPCEPKCRSGHGDPSVSRPGELAGHGPPAAVASAYRQRRCEHLQHPMAESHTIFTRHHFAEPMERVQQSRPLGTWYGRRIYDRAVERSRTDSGTRMPANSGSSEGRQRMEKDQSAAD